MWRSVKVTAPVGGRSLHSFTLPPILIFLFLNLLLSLSLFMPHYLVFSYTCPIISCILLFLNKGSRRDERTSLYHWQSPGPSLEQKIYRASSSPCGKAFIMSLCACPLGLQVLLSDLSFLDGFLWNMNESLIALSATGRKIAYSVRHGRWKETHPQLLQF